MCWWSAPTCIFHTYRPNRHDDTWQTCRSECKHLRCKCTNNIWENHFFWRYFFVREWFSQYMVRSAYHSSGFVAVHRDLPPFIGICNPDALSIRIFNPLKAHYKCLHSMRADCKYWSYGRNTTHRCIYIPWQCSGNRTTGPEHRGRHPCRAWRNRHDDLLLRQWKSIPREPSHDWIKCKFDF